MKRALALLAACSLFGFAGLAQFSGEWDTTINVLPTLGLEETSLTLNYTFAGWALTSVSTFDSTGFASQSFEAEGALGPVEIEASMAFCPGTEYLKDIKQEFQSGSETITYRKYWSVTGPHYDSAELSAALEFGGVKLGIAVAHDADYVATFGLDDFGSWAGNEEEYYPESSLCFDKYLLTTIEWETDVKATVTYYDDAGTPTDTSDDVALGTYSGTFEYNPVAGELTAEALAWIAAYGTSGPDTALHGYDYYTVTIDPDDVVVRAWLPSYMTWTFTAEADPVSAKVVFDDVCTGIQFKEATIGFADLSLCCGITFGSPSAVASRSTCR